MARIIAAYPLLLARFRATRRFRFRPFAPGMPRCRNRSRFHHFMAYRALFMPDSRLFARRRLVDYPFTRRMACRRYFLVCRIIAPAACIVLCPTRFRACCRTALMVYKVMPQRFHRTGFHMARIVRTCSLFLARFRATRRFRLRPFAPGVACYFNICRNIFHGNSVELRIHKIAAGNAQLRFARRYERIKRYRNHWHIGRNSVLIDERKSYFAVCRIGIYEDDVFGDGFFDRDAFERSIIVSDNKIARGECGCALGDHLHFKPPVRARIFADIYRRICYDGRHIQGGDVRRCSV